MSKPSMTQEVFLPSRGLLNSDIPDGRIVQRVMMLKDQKYLSASSSLDGGVHRLLEETIVEPTGIDVSKLTIPDTIFLMVSLRNISFGPKYKFLSRCPACGKTVVAETDLSEIEIFDLDESYEKYMEVEIPSTGDKAKLRFLTNHDSENIKIKEDRLRAKGTDASGFGYEEGVKLSIDKIYRKNPEKDESKVIDGSIEIDRYVADNFSALDGAIVMAAIDSVVYGVSDKVRCTCPECRKTVYMGFQIAPGFFRPGLDLPTFRHLR